MMDYLQIDYDGIDIDDFALPSKRGCVRRAASLLVVVLLTVLLVAAHNRIFIFSAIQQVSYLFRLRRICAILAELGRSLIIIRAHRCCVARVGHVQRGLVHALLHALLRDSLNAIIIL